MLSSSRIFRLALFSLTVTLPAFAQQSPPQQQPPSDQPIPLGMRLGRRVELVRQNILAFPQVVIVDSPAAYAHMISQWTLRGRFPVLIDDGSHRAAQDIARFVRGFAPKSIVRWQPTEETAQQLVLPKSSAARAEAIAQVARAAWGAASEAQLQEIWNRTNFRPPGVVVARASDPAWTAALALAAARGQPIIWTDAPSGSPSGSNSAAQLAALDQSILSGLAALKDQWSWRELGDDIDGVTLCLNQPSKYKDGSEILALTDHIGRHADGSRWAWCGMIFGSESQAAYRAMCSIFIQPNSAWLFDSYRDKFKGYEIRHALEMLEQTKFSVATNLPPAGGLTHWRGRSEHGTGAGLILVNTQGFAHWFDLAPGRARPGDVPMLRVPALVHFIHSFSAESIDDESTIGGRWLERGAMGYLGACDEPFLGAFVPNHAVAARLLSTFALGSVVRHDAGPFAKPWKLNLFADPLFTLSPFTSRHESPGIIAGAVRLEEEMRSALKNHELARGARALVMLGRDEDVAKLARSAMRAEGDELSHDLARIALPAAFRTDDKPLLLDCFERVAANKNANAQLRDYLWHAMRDELSEGSPDERTIDLLRRAIRPESADDDAASLAPALSKTRGSGAVRSMYAELIAQAKLSDVRKGLEKGLKSW